MADATTLDAPVDVEPKDKRTNEWKAWRARQTMEVSAVTVTPPVEAPPAPSTLPTAAPAPIDPRRVVLNPIEFATLVLTRNPREIIAYSGQPNPTAAVAGDVKTLYEAYLVIVSPAYAEHFRKANLPAGVRAILPDIGAFERMYGIATGQ
jgi:hypothetical protein